MNANEPGGFISFLFVSVRSFTAYVRVQNVPHPSVMFKGKGLEIAIEELTAPKAAKYSDAPGFVRGRPGIVFRMHALVELIRRQRMRVPLVSL